MAGKGSGRRKENSQLVRDNWDKIQWTKNESLADKNPVSDKDSLHKETMQIDEELEQDELNQFDIDAQQDDNGITDWRYTNG